MRCRPPASAFLLLAPAAGTQALPAATPEALVAPGDQPAMTLSANRRADRRMPRGHGGGAVAWIHDIVGLALDQPAGHASTPKLA